MINQNHTKPKKRYVLTHLPASVWQFLSGWLPSGVTVYKRKRGRGKCFLMKLAIFFTAQIVANHRCGHCHI